MHVSDIPLDKNCQVIEYHDSGIWILDKAPGVLSHPNEKKSANFKQKTLLRADYCMQTEKYTWDSDCGTHEFYLCHRLDSPTSGIIIGCNDANIATEIKNAFSKRRIQKTYLAVTQGYNSAKMGKWQDQLSERKKAGKLRVQKGNDERAVTIASRERMHKGRFNLNLLKLKPLTGRTHQLRYQCMVRKMPILGDKTYGNFSLNRQFTKATKIDRLCLHASEIEFEIKVNKDVVKIQAESPLPRQLGKLFT